MFLFVGSGDTAQPCRWAFFLRCMLAWLCFKAGKPSLSIVGANEFLRTHRDGLQLAILDKLPDFSSAQLVGLAKLMNRESTGQDISPLFASTVMKHGVFMRLVMVFLTRDESALFQCARFFKRCLLFRRFFK
jgi:hypothetical protein